MIEAEREFEEEDEKDDFYRHEMGYGKLSRTVALPVEVDPEKIHAELKEGILTVTLPKIRMAERQEVRTARRPTRRKANRATEQRNKSRWYWTCHPDRALSETVVPLGVTRKGNAIPGDRRPRLRG
jgi:hypothetical protein